MYKCTCVYYSNLTLSLVVRRQQNTTVTIITPTAATSKTRLGITTCNTTSTAKKVDNVRIMHA